MNSPQALLNTNQNNISKDTSTEILSSTDKKALDLLGAGVTVAQTAAAIGVTESRIAQLLSDDYFAERLASVRFEALAKHNERDNEYDKIEDQLIKQLKSTLPMVMQPEKIVRMLQVINSAKRRGASSPDAIHQKQTVIQLQLPIQIINRFATNGINQVVSVDAEDGNSKQSMVTVQSGQMKKLVEHQRELDAEKNLFLKETGNKQKTLSQYGFD
jgi:hypothetical protein